MLEFARIAGGFELRRRPYTPHHGLNLRGEDVIVHEFGRAGAIVAGNTGTALQSPLTYYGAANDLEARPCPHQA